MPGLRVRCTCLDGAPATLGRGWGAAPCCGRLCKFVPPTMLGVGRQLHHDGRFTDRPHSLAMQIPHRASTRLSSGAGSVPASRSGPDLASIKAHAGAPFLRGCRVDHRSIRASSPPASLACRESWRGRGLRLGLHGCNRPAQTISPAPGAFLAQQILWASRSSTLLRPLRGAASPSRAGRITDKNAMGAILQPRKEIHHG